MPVAAIEINWDALRKIAIALDKPLNKRAGYTQDDIRGYLLVLEVTGAVEVGWRESCGTTDPTMHTYRAWLQFVKKAKAHGLVLTEERQKHGNGWATKKGGFWNSIVYRIDVPGTTHA